MLIRIGPGLIELRRERWIGRILNDRDGGDRFTPSPRPDPNLRLTYDTAGRSDPASEHAAPFDQALARAQRDLAIVEDRLRAAELKLGALSAPATRVRFDEPVAYAYQWVPPAGTGGQPPTVLRVPGVVRGYIDPTGRVINVLM